MKKFLMLLIFEVGCAGCFSQAPVEDLFQKETAERKSRLQPLLLKAEEARKIQNPEKMSKVILELEDELAKLPPSLHSTEVVVQIRKMVAQMYVAVGKNAASKNHWNMTRDCALRACRADPDLADAKELLQGADEILRRGTERGQPVNPAMDDPFFDKLEAVRGGLETGKALQETGQLDKADEVLQQVLRDDPYNKAAIAELGKVQDEKLIVSNELRDTAFRQKKREVREGWNSLLEVKPRSQESKASKSELLNKSKEAAFKERLEAVKNIPEVNFPGLELGAVIQSLNALENQYGSTKSGGNVRFASSEKLEGKDIPLVSLKLRDVNLWQVVQYVEKLAGIKGRPNLDIYEFGPLVETDELILQTFPRVSPSFFSSDRTKLETEAPARIRGGTGFQAENISSSGGKIAAQDYLSQLGVEFKNGAFAAYNNNSKTLKVYNTPEMCELVAELIAAAQEDTLLIRIDCRLVEINQTDLDSLTANSTLGGSGSALLNVFPTGLIPSSSGQTPNPSQQQGLTMQLNQIQGVGLLPNNTIQSFLAPGVLAGPNQASSYDLNTMQLGGSIMGGMQFRTLITAISQKSSANVLARPSIILKRGQKGEIEVSQEFRYVKEYNDPQSSVRTFIPTGAAAGTGGLVTPIPGPETVISAFPSQISDPEPIGVKMGVKPDIAGENMDRVRLELEPKFVDFEGFINYGATVNSAYAATYFGDATTILTNNIQQPVFVRRDLVLPPIEVKDGYTLALGGLLREDIQSIDEKVPIFGDIPLLGRAFQGKTQQAIKKNTLIFVTPAILRTDGSPFNRNSDSETETSTPGPNLVSNTAGIPQGN